MDTSPVSKLDILGSVIERPLLRVGGLHGYSLASKAVETKRQWPVIVTLSYRSAHVVRMT